jgi:hypothetical protein
MGQPINWDYALIVRPQDSTTFVQLFRWQRNTTTRFLWAETDMQCTLTSPTLDNVLQELYGALLVLMEQTA